MELKERIVVDPEVMAGQPVVRGTRLTVDWIVGLLAQGWSQERLLQNYPGLTSEDVDACVEFARLR